MRLAFAAVVFAAMVVHDAFGQTAYFSGLTPKPKDVYPLDASVTVTRSAPPGGAPIVVPALYTHVTTDPASRTFEWASLSILNNSSEFGANVATYGQANKTGSGTTWAGVLELQDATGSGGFFGLEIDALTTGASPVPGSQNGDRIGLGIILGRAGHTGPKATIDYGIFVAPTDMRDSEADVNFGMMVFAQCRYACYAMRAGNKLAWEESAQIASKFDPDTGRWGLFHGEKPIFEVDVNSGELRVNGRPVNITYKDQATN
jgi:hypothetical protein